MSIHCGTPSDCPTRLRAALAAAEANAHDGCSARIAALENALMESSAKRCAAESALADERRHADALAGAVREAASMCVRQVFPHATLDWVLKSHAVRRAAEVANG